MTFLTVNPHSLQPIITSSDKMNPYINPDQLFQTVILVKWTSFNSHHMVPFI